MNYVATITTATRATYISRNFTAGGIQNAFFRGRPLSGIGFLERHRSELVAPSILYFVYRVFQATGCACEETDVAIGRPQSHRRK